MIKEIYSLEELLSETKNSATLKIIEDFLSQFLQTNPTVTRVCPQCQCCYFGTNEIINKIKKNIYK
jgi:hypothetical protein